LPRYLVYCLIFTCVAVVFYFSWQPDPHIGSNSYFPKWLREWTNAYGNLRTAVPFVFLGAVLESEFIKIQNPVITRLYLMLASILVVTIAELGQLALPLRHFDWMDILWGTIGSLCGMLLTIGFKWIVARL